MFYCIVSGIRKCLFVLKIQTVTDHIIQNHILHHMQQFHDQRMEKLKNKQLNHIKKGSGDSNLDQI